MRRGGSWGSRAASEHRGVATHMHAALRISPRIFLRVFPPIFPHISLRVFPHDT